MLQPVVQSVRYRTGRSIILYTIGVIFQYTKTVRYSLPNKRKKLYGEHIMDRRIRKTRETIFHAFTTLLSKKSFDAITVSEIIEKADVGRATFYAHFETKDFLLKALCEDLFCHIFDKENGNGGNHRHVFECDGTDAAFLHLFRHLGKNDNNILTLLSAQNNELFLRYFRNNLEELIKKSAPLLEDKRNPAVPTDFWHNHVAGTFVEALRFWIKNGKKESPEQITEYFLAVL